MATIPRGLRHPLSNHVATHGGAHGHPQPGQHLRALASALVSLLLVGLLLLLPSGCERRRQTAAPQPLPPSAPAGQLQEVAPPPAVQQLQNALAERAPQVAIEQPADGATLPSGSWTLRLKVRDWPLVDAGPLGLGAHIAVQIDDRPVLRLTDHRPSSSGDVVETSLPALSPGSHRITAYAARPWGEAVKAPGASDRIRVQNLAANPLALPAPGTPELVAVSPSEATSAEPVLLDWLLFDAPLQHLREGDGSWRLRVSVNGDAFLVDQNVPIWLRGWSAGSNALQLELVDGRGEPLNPPFNSLVREVKLGGASQPRWLAGPLQPNELAMLLGELPPPPAEPDTPAEPEPAAAPQPAAAPPVAQPPDEAEVAPEAGAEPSEPLTPAPAGEPELPEPGSTPADPATAEPGQPADAQEPEPAAEPPLAGLRQRLGGS